jgi:hypothetical protein
MYRSVDLAVYERCARNLSGTTRSLAKMATREAFLQENPQARIRPNTTRLQAVVPYTAFRCHPDCSVARHTAIEGSDIDGGIVVTTEPMTPQQQLAFVEELRAQGFTATTQQEADETKAKTESGDYIAGSVESSEAIKQKVRADLSKIRFMSHEEAERNIAETPWNVEVLIAGAEVN